LTFFLLLFYILYMQVIHNKGYNEYNEYNFNLLINEFKKYLQINDKTSVTIKNYLSDIRFFFGWIISILNLEITKTTLEAIDGAKINSFKKYLLDSSLPSSTINRRLSSVRIFFFFCTENKIISHNPSLNLSNVHNDSTSQKKIPLKSAFIRSGFDFISTEHSELSEKQKNSLQKDIREFVDYLIKTE